jgi:ABC-type xylose transport system substrate-binding protein
MVFGNMGEDSGTGVAFTRNPANGENKLFGEFLKNAQGEDVVAGVRTPQPIDQLENEFPVIYKQFHDIAMKLAENVLTANNNKIHAILDANDSTAAGVMQALIEQNLNGKIPITGQDADLAACKSIVKGDQTMSVYKPLKNLAEAAIDLAFKVATGAKVDTNATYPNGKIDVPSINLPITAVDKNNMMDTVIKDGFHTYDEVYADVPEAQRPPKPAA